MFTIKQGDIQENIDLETVFVLLTNSNGYFMGQPVYFKAIDKFNRDLWIAYISIATANSFMFSKGEDMNRFTRFVRRLRHIYTGPRVQSVVGGLVRIAPSNPQAPNVLNIYRIADIAQLPAPGPQRPVEARRWEHDGEIAGGEAPT
jgi:hypothetical protein